MGLVVSYDEKLGIPNSEIALASGEHVSLTLGRDGLLVKLLSRPGAAERILFHASPATTARICDGLFDIGSNETKSPLRMLVAATVHLPDAAAVENAFSAAAKA
ncbi:MAG: hypothetical protein AB7E79_09870 [Rhodospirillaceae bacterium]